MSSYPLIIIGMHRSGTSLLARLLSEAGLFLGWRTQLDHDEAVFFQTLNRWAMRQATADWDRPAGVADLLDVPTAREAAVDYLELSVSSPRVVQFMGPARYVRHRSLTRLDGPWGWKDPRTTFTLPMWAEIFPDARVLHVTRHGVDVAESLRVRERKYLAAKLDGYRSKRRRFALVSERSLFSQGLSVLDIDRGLALWDDYVTESERHVEAFGDRALAFRYEDFLAAPRDVMVDVLDFCGLATPADIAWLDSVDSSRAFAFAADPELTEVASRHEEILARHGYSSAAN